MLIGVGAMIRLRKKRPDLDRGFKVLLFSVLSVAGILMLLFLAVYMPNYSRRAWIVTLFGKMPVLCMSEYEEPVSFFVGLLGRGRAKRS